MKHNHSQRTNANSAITTLLLAVFSTSIGSFLLLRGIEKTPSHDHPGVLAIMALSLGFSIISAFYAGLYRGLFLRKINPFGDHPTIASYIAIVQTFATLLFMAEKIPSAAFYAATIVFQSWGSHLYFKIITPGLNVKHPIIGRLPWIASLSTGLFGVAAWPLQNFWPIEKLLGATAVWQSITLMGLVVGVWSWFALHPKFSIPGQKVVSLFSIRLQRDDNRPSLWIMGFAFCSLQCGALLFTYQQSSNGLSPAWPIVLLTYHFYVIPCLLEAWSRFSKFGIDKEQYQTLARLAANSARKMLHRQSSLQHNWAAAVGVKTTAFTIDHDPESDVAQNIPATLLRIRNDEIFSIVNKIIHDRSLSLNTVSNKIIGSLDPELSPRPCVDALNLFASLYLDAAPIIERRIAGLVSLLPIVNPGLAQIVSSNQILPLLRRSHWFFHFDFSWVDQSLINTTGGTRYGIQMDPVSLATQWSLITQMKKTHSLGNFLWIGRDANERLLQEAPHIASIIQPHVLNDGLGGSEQLIFIIKFEQLIPRLQRYYDLDKVRSRITDYEPRPEAQRLLNLMTLQSQAARSLPEKSHVIDSLISYNWQGFKEKDQALRLLLRIYQSEIEAINQNETTDSGCGESFMTSLRTAITSIGYPSQILNQAHVYKIELRNTPKLRVHALNHNSPRFEEAWILMSNMTYRSLHQDDVRFIKDIVQSTLKDPRIMASTFVHGKLIDTVVALGRRNDASEEDLNRLMNLVEQIVNVGTTDECLALALDGLGILSKKFQKPVHFSQSAHRAIEQRLKEDHDQTPGQSTALSSRWQELISESVSNKSLTHLKAS